MRIKLTAGKCCSDYKFYIEEIVSATKGFTCLLFFVFFFLLPVASWADCTGSSPTWNSTADYASVNSCLSSATAGDTINVSSGDATWDSTLTITKSINLMGAGIGSTNISRGSIATGNGIILINLSSDVPVRVSGFTFDNGTDNSTEKYAIAFTTANPPRSKIRIDHNRFNRGHRCLKGGLFYGVVDHNQFNNCFQAFYGTDAGWAAWNEGMAAGTSKALFFEDNTITHDNTETNHVQFYFQDGARVVARYNKFDFSNLTNDSMYAFYMHGNAGPAPQYWSDDKGSPIFEAYNNTFIANNGGLVFDLRSGSNIIHDNTLIGNAGGIMLTEEECWSCAQNGQFCPGLTTWPAHCQVMNSFFWNNGNNMTPYLYSSCDATFIQQDRDYFLHAPQSSGGLESYPGNVGDITMTFTSSGANADYPYTPYTYPHPLVTGNSPTSTTTPDSPRNLQVL